MSKKVKGWRKPQSQKGPVLDIAVLDIADIVLDIAPKSLFTFISDMC